MSDTLESQARDYLTQATSGTADAIDKKFVIMEEVVTVMAVYVLSLSFYHYLLISSFTIYFGHCYIIVN